MFSIHLVNLCVANLIVVLTGSQSWATFPTATRKASDFCLAQYSIVHIDYTSPHEEIQSVRPSQQQEIQVPISINIRIVCVRNFCPKIFTFLCAHTRSGKIHINFKMCKLLHTIKAMAKIKYRGKDGV